MVDRPVRGPAPATCSRRCRGRRRRRSAAGGGARPPLPRAESASRPELGQAEVEDLDPAVLGDEQVLGLQVPMDDPLSWAAARPCAIWTAYSMALRAGTGLAQALAQRHAVEELEDDVGAPVLAARRRRPPRGSGWLRAPGGLRLLLEAAQPIGVGGGVRGQDLDCHLAPEPRVARAVYLAHAARADASENLVPAQGALPAARVGSSSRRPASVNLRPPSVWTARAGSETSCARGPGGSRRHRKGSRAR